MIIRDRQYRDKFRETILNFISKEEVFVFHPLIDHHVVSNTGKVKNLLTGKYLTPFLNSDNYKVLNLFINGKGRRCVMLHRIIAEAFYSYLGYNNYFYEVNHIDGKKENNNINNLEWLTREENLEHSRKMRLWKAHYGENNGNSKLTNKDVHDIKVLRDLGFSAKEIATSYNCNSGYIHQILKGKARLCQI